MECNGIEQNKLGLFEVLSGELRWRVDSYTVDAPGTDVYEIRCRKDGGGFDLISDQFRRGPIWYAGPDAVRHAMAYAKYCSWSRSRRAVIRVLDHSQAVIEA